MYGISTTVLYVLPYWYQSKMSERVETLRCAKD